MKKVKEFLLNLNNDDIDLINKLSNMYGSEIQNIILYNILTENEHLQKLICICLKEIVKDNLDYIAKFVKEETEQLYEEELINDKNDYSSGLYNYDSLYVEAIEMALNLELDVD